MATRKPAPPPEPEKVKAPPPTLSTPKRAAGPILPGCSQPNTAPPSVYGTSQDPTRKEN